MPSAPGCEQAISGRPLAEDDMFEPHDALCRSRRKALKIVSCAVFASLVLLCAQVVLLQAGLARAQGTLDVCQGCTYESIQEAIDAADPGDTIRVAQGVYTENLVITKSLTLLGGFESGGWSRDIDLYETTIDGNRSGSVISVSNGCSTTIDGFTITNGATDRGGGIYVDGSAVMVTNNQIRQNITWFTRQAITITEPLRAGDTAVSGVCDPDLVDLVYAWDVTTDSYVGLDHAEPEGTFTVTFWSPLVEGHVIAAFGAYGYDEAIVQPALGAGDQAGAPEEAPGIGFGDAVASNAGGERFPTPERLARGLGRADAYSLSGGGIYLLDSTAVISANQIVSNTARDFGGGVCVKDSMVTISGNEVAGNYSGRVFAVPWYEGYGGGIAMLPGSQFTVSANLLADNRVVRGGGGIYITDSVGSLVGNEIRGNGTGDAWEEQAIGGGVYVANCSPLIEGNEIISNMLGTEQSPTPSCAYGAGIHLAGSSSVVADNRIAGNGIVVGWYSSLRGLERGQGGGIHVQPAPGDSCLHWEEPEDVTGACPIIAGNQVAENRVFGYDDSVAGGGGGIASWRTSIRIHDNEVTGNSSGADGGGILAFSYPVYEDDITVEISGNIIVSNTSDPIRSAGAGGMIVGGMTSTISGNVIEGNLGGLAGGMIVAGPHSVIEKNRIVGNTAAMVGGLLGEETGEILVLDNLIAENTGGSVGGVAAHSVSMLVARNEIVSNTGRLGGGFGGGPANLTMDANLIFANQATDKGGGIHIWEDTPFTLTNNIIADNSAEELGGGIYVIDSEGALINNTIAQNQEGAGEGVYLDGTADATMLNNIIVSHTHGIYNAGSGTPDVTYNDVWGNSVGDYYGVTPGVGNISSDPRFVDPDGWDYHLWLYSPAVDAAHSDEDLAPAWDIDGDPRPLGSRVDMGADEVPFEVWVWKSDQPDPVLPGGLVTYTIRLSNVSEERYGRLVMTDRVPVNTSLYWASDEGEETEGVVSWAVGSLGVGEMVTRTVVVQVDQGLTDGTVIDNAEYGASSEELSRPVMGMPVQTRVGVPLLEISKVAEPDPVRAGGVLTYTLTVTNNGGIGATELEIWDRVPEDSQLSWASDGGEETGGVVSWSVGELGSGQSLERTMVVTEGEGLADGTLIENAEYGVQCDEVAEPVLGPLVSTTVGEPVLVIGKSDEPDPVLPGETLTYTIVVSNDGGWETTGVVITDRIPTGTTFSEASDGGEESGGVVTWTVPSLEAGGSLERTLVVTVSEGLADGSVIENDGYGVKSEDMEAVLGVSVSTLVGQPLLTISKEVEPELAVPGGELEYTLTVNNEGHHAATGVVITDRVPLDASFAWVLDGGELVGDEVRWSGLTVGPGESVVVRWGATVTDDLLVEEVVNDSYGVLCSEVAEAVMGVAQHTPILRYRLLFPLGMNRRVWA